MTTRDLTPRQDIADSFYDLIGAYQCERWSRGGRQLPNAVCLSGTKDVMAGLVASRLQLELSKRGLPTVNYAEWLQGTECEIPQEYREVIFRDADRTTMLEDREPSVPDAEDGDDGRSFPPGTRRKHVGILRGWEASGSE